ncbi:MAG: dihydroorotase, partial [Chloroflexi bacterium]|nr:dihydroorotase [Chloroflexota bacterium]
CEVTPHHLFLTEDDAQRLGPLGYMKPELKPASDVEALWANLDVIDCIADDHAPHTLAEKQGDDPPPGVPGLETTLPLMLHAVAEGRLSMDKLVEMVDSNPRRIFALDRPPETYAVIDLDHHYAISPDGLQTKVGWTPFEGHDAVGAVRRVVVRGQTVYKDGQFVGGERSPRLILA